MSEERFAGRCRGGPLDGEDHICRGPWLRVVDVAERLTLPAKTELVSAEAMGPRVVNHLYEWSDLAKGWEYRGVEAG